ncbi:restriction endonuclease subunit S, partial [Escherichia coli]
WTPIKLGSIVNITNGFAFKSENFLTSLTFNTLPVLKIKNVANGDVHLKDVQYHLIDSKYDKYTSSKGDILITLTGNHPQALTQVVGAVSKQKFDTLAYINQRVAKIDPISSLAFKDFIYYFLKEKSTHDYLASQSSGSANQANISKADIENVELLLPPVTEQIAIASVLSSLDDKIDLLHRQNKTLESMANTLFRQWFIEESQDEWPEATLNQYVELNKSSIDKKYNIKEIQYLDTGSLTKGKISKLQKILLSDAPSRAKRLVNNFDIIISTVRPDQCHYGICIAPPSNLVVSTGFCVITSKSLSPFFIYYLITSEDMTEYLHSIAEGSTSTYPSLKPEDIGNIPFLYPSEEKLKNFHDLVGSYWNKIHNNHKKIQTLETLRDTLLPKLMSGDVRVQYAEEAIASVA